MEFINMIISFISKILVKTIGNIFEFLRRCSYKGYLRRKKVTFCKDIIIRGGVELYIYPQASVSIGKEFICNGQNYGIDSGINSCIYVGKDAELTIGDSVGMSNTSIHCVEKIHIGNYVNIGGGCKIFDSNFHSTKWQDRGNRKKDIQNRLSAPVFIGDYVFIGARSIICKGVTIGDRTMIAAGSVVVNNIPADCIAGGNPAKVIKKNL